MNVRKLSLSISTILFVGTLTSGLIVKADEEKEKDDGHEDRKKRRSSEIMMTNTG